MQDANASLKIGKDRIESINRVECIEQGCLIQVSFQLIIEDASKKENINRLKLTCSSLLWHPNLANSLGHPGIVNLAYDVLRNK